MRAYHQARSDEARRRVAIPDSAHGTNPASAAMAGFEVVQLASDEAGNVDLEALHEVVGPDLAGVMITLPSTLGLFDTNIVEVCRLVHQAGGLVYGDGANMNALLGRVKLGDLGFDVVHLNLHKTFSTPTAAAVPAPAPSAPRSLWRPICRRRWWSEPASHPPLVMGNRTQVRPTSSLHPKGPSASSAVSTAILAC